MSAPPSSAATSAGMSRGSFWRSPSEVTMIAPRAAANPAENAAVWPKLRRNRITRRRGSAACSAARIAKLSSVLPSSTATISNGRPHALSVSTSSAWSWRRFGDSLWMGMTTERSGGMRTGGGSETAGLYQPGQQRPDGGDLVLVDGVAHARVDAQVHLPAQRAEDLGARADHVLRDVAITVAAAEEDGCPAQAGALRRRRPGLVRGTDQPSGQADRRAVAGRAP